MEVVKQFTHIVDWNCEIQPFCEAHLERNDAYRLAFVVDEWAAAIPRIDSGIGLQNLEILTGIPYRTDDASGDCSCETNRTSNDNHRLSSRKRVRVAQVQYGEAIDETVALGERR